MVGAGIAEEEVYRRSLDESSDDLERKPISENIIKGIYGTGLLIGIMKVSNVSFSLSLNTSCTSFSEAIQETKPHYLNPCF